MRDLAPKASFCFTVYMHDPVRAPASSRLRGLRLSCTGEKRVEDARTV